MENFSFVLISITMESQHSSGKAMTAAKLRETNSFFWKINKNSTVIHFLDGGQQSVCPHG
jgi:hypothetical protein